MYRLLLTLAVLSLVATAQVTTQHNDTARTGQILTETILTPANVNATRFGKLFATGVDGFVMGQPLYLPQLTMGDGSVHNVVFAATMHDSVYAFDAQNGTVLWTRSMLPLQAGTVPIGAQGCPATGLKEVGILSTPVIDPANNTIFVVAKTQEAGGYVFRLHALDVTTGLDKAIPAVISGSVATTSGVTQFNAGPQMQRAGLLLSNGNVYVAFTSNGCDYGATGWIMAYDENTLSQTAIFNDDADQNFGGSIWQSGKGLAADGAGNIFFATANGVANPSAGDFGESIVRLTGSLNYTDYFSPNIYAYLNSDDYDIGSGGVILLPDQPGLAPHLLVGGGKEGTVYLLNRDNLGQLNMSADQAVQEIQGGNPTVAGGGTGAAYWNNNIYYASTGGLRMFSLNNGALTPVSIPTAASKISGKGLPSVSANGAANGIVWVLRGPNYSSTALAAYNATGMAQLYASTQAANGRDTLGATGHFATPTIANGRVYVGTQTQLVIYGLLPQLKTYSGNNQSGTAGATLTKPLQTKAVDSYSGLAQPNEVITFTDNGAGGSFNPPTATTNASGIAGTIYTLPSVAGTVKITANSNGFAAANWVETAY